MLGSNRPLKYDKRKASVTWSFVKYCLFLFAIRWLDLITPAGLALFYVLGGVVFSLVLCFEPYYAALPKRLTPELFRARPGFGFNGKYILATTVSQYRIDGKHYVSFYWFPYNWLYVQLMRFEWLRRKTLRAQYGNRFWSCWVVLVGLRYYKASAAVNEIDTLAAIGRDSSIGAQLLNELMWDIEGVGMKCFSDLKELAADLSLLHVE